TATLGNVLILIALNKVTSICPSTKLLFRCLAVTDLCVGLITQPLLTVTLLTSFNYDEYVEDIQVISSMVLFGASFGCLLISGIHFFVFGVVMLISLLISAISYAKIYFRLRHQLLHVQGHVHQRQQLPPNGVVPTALNVARYKKTVSFIAWVQLGLFACYSPLCITLVSPHFAEFLDDNTIFFFLCLLFLNSSLNPILYCWKIRE
ncbi:unnamed protein product, partial [Pocillopora meandrina]